MAATAQVSVRPSTENPSGTAPTRSRWLIQICCGPASPANSGSSASSSSSVARPYSPLLALPHCAAQQVRHELLAVADAEHGLAAVEDCGIDGGAARVVDAGWAAGDDDAFARTASSAAGVSLGRTSA